MTIERFKKLFAGLDRAYGYTVLLKGRTDKGKVNSESKTVQQEVSDGLYNEHLKGEQSLAIIPIMDDGCCWFGAIDIDNYKLDFNLLEERIDKLKLPLVICRSKSGGAHLFLFLKTPATGKTVKQKLSNFAIALGHGGAEIFPKQEKLANKYDVGNHINIPYFNAKSTVRYAYKNGKGVRYSDFLDLAENTAVTAVNLEKFTTPKIKEFEDAPPCLQHYVSNGVSEGGRNKVMFNFAVYCTLKYEDTWEEQIPAINKQYFHPPIDQRELQATVLNSIRKHIASDKPYFYTCKDTTLSLFCNKTLCYQRKFGVGGAPPVNFTNLIKIDTDPPLWFLGVNGVRIQFETADLLEQNRFRKVCMEKLHKIPHRMKGEDWDKNIQFVLDTVEIVEAPEDASIGGQFKIMLEEFCTNMAVAKDKTELLIGKPWTDNEEKKTYFRIMDLKRYLQNQKFKGIDGNKLFSVIRDIGGGSKHVSLGNGRAVRTWYVPAYEEFDKTLVVPEVKKGDF